MIARAAELRRDGDAPGAIEVLADVLTSEPDNATATVEMARALRLLGDPAEAEEHLRRALELVLDYQLVVELAEVVAEQDRVDEAMSLLDAADLMAAKNPRLDPGQALVARATIHAALGEDDIARAMLDRLASDRALRKRTNRSVHAYADRLRASLSP